MARWKASGKGAEIKRVWGEIGKRKNRVKQAGSAGWVRKADRDGIEVSSIWFSKEIQEIVCKEHLYFKEPSELIEYFNNLEENNLFCIQNAQYAEEKYQEFKIRSEENKNTLNAKYRGHQEEKKQLEKQLADLETNIKYLKKKKEQNSDLDEKDNRDIRATISAEYHNIKDTMK